MLAKRKAQQTDEGPKRPKLHFGSHTVSDETAPPTAIRVVILTFERPDVLLTLLQDIDANRGEHEVSVSVYDDASRKDYAKVRMFLDERGWEYTRARSNHGKRGFWRWVSRIYREQKTRPERIFVLLPDDMRLCDRFFDRALNTWDRIRDPTKVALNLLRDNSRDGQSCWTHQKPIDCGPVFDIGWVDGAILCNRRYFKALDWQLEPVDPQRWRIAPRSSSGVGQQISLRLHEQGLGMYGVKRSLTAHLSGGSKMNPIERRKNPLLAIHFIDGEDEHRALAGASAPPKAPAPPARKAPKRIARVRMRRGRNVLPSGVGGVKKVK